MRKLKKYIIMLILMVVVVFMIYKVFMITYNKDLNGSIEVASNAENYNYLKASAEKFMSMNKKIEINVTKYTQDEIVGYLNKTLSSESEVNLVTLNSKILRNLDDDSLEKINYSDNLIEGYSKNFNLWRLNEIKKEGHYLAMPIQNNPQFLMVREDILNQYGYKSEDIRTWSELIALYKDIKNKYDKKIDLFSYDLTTTKNIEDIIIYQGGTVDQGEEIISAIENENLMGKDTPLCYIADKNNYNEIISKNLENSLRAIMIPAIVIGGNRAVSLDGDNIVIMRSNYEKQEISNKFLTFLIANQSLIDEKLIDNEGFFPSSKAFYNNIIVDKEFDKINNQKILSIMTNIANRVPNTTDYEEVDNILNNKK